MTDIIDITKMMWHDWPIGRINCILILAMPFLIAIIAWISFHNSRFFSKKESLMCEIIKREIIPAFDEPYNDDYDPGTVHRIHHPQTWLIHVKINTKRHEVSVSKKDFNSLPEKGCALALCVCGKFPHRIRHIERLSLT